MHEVPLLKSNKQTYKGVLKVKVETVEHGFMIC